ncbi:phage repressor protein CI [Klebsiella pneumoniae]|jgi:phage repressor protein C with HTH and peptisase S24 domain|uniref:Repressor protein n=3 Tax=Klebsiella pneumoniae complex TaxID=3390273 RepID=A0A483IUS8_KLEPN|nr:MULTISPECIES: phage repressor protein CI [Klebsiella]VFS33913.1 Bacteriophage CI repressor helix-turn-helix domain [Serratia liquefaciens]DAY54354.1 MAG TPA: CI repressor [Caudoviricetes sp.]HBZ7224093.1 phage repressor protein CI [Klebsiella variicola subsp. variicola]HDH0901466.1 phage repressor protein CI [Klebsiella oxytoca]ALQ85704.1 repressor [Klebsiella pneumoniae]
MKLQIDFSQGGNDTLDRVIEAYGFRTKVALAEHLGIASSSLANRYKRDFFPADIVVRCMAETGATLEWLVTGNGPKFDGEDLDILRIARQKIVDGQLYDSGVLMLDKATFLPGKAVPTKPLCIIESSTTYVIEREFSEVFDGEWLVDIEGKTSVRTLTRIPVKKVRVSGAGAAFDCSIDDISVIGRVVLTIISG